MSTTKIGPKHQITIPRDVFEELRLDVGDILEAEVESGKIVLAPKQLTEKAPVLNVPEPAGSLQQTHSAPYGREVAPQLICPHRFGCWCGRQTTPSDLLQVDRSSEQHYSKSLAGKPTRLFERGDHLPLPT